MLRVKGVRRLPQSTRGGSWGRLRSPYHRRNNLMDLKIIGHSAEQRLTGQWIRQPSARHCTIVMQIHPDDHSRLFACACRRDPRFNNCSIEGAGRLLNTDLTGIRRYPVYCSGYILVNIVPVSARRSPHCGRSIAGVRATSPKAARVAVVPREPWITTSCSSCSGFGTPSHPLGSTWSNGRFPT